jgi:hypothetical protein
MILLFITDRTFLIHQHHFTLQSPYAKRTAAEGVVLLMQNENINITVNVEL